MTMKTRHPNQQRPPKVWWYTWRNFLLVFSNADILLLHPLGKWIEHKEYIHPWKWYSKEYINTLLEWTGPHWFQPKRSPWLHEIF
jgi:hypothetical protein